MMRFLKPLILVLILPISSPADDFCESALQKTGYSLAITELVKGYQALERAEIEGESKTTISFMLKALNKRKAELEAIYGKEKFTQIFTDAKSKILAPDNGNRIRRRKAIIEESKAIKIWEEGALLTAQGSELLSSHFSPDGKLILSITNNGSAQMWDAETGRFLVFLKGYVTTLDYKSASFSADSRYVISVRDDDVVVWDAESGKMLKNSFVGLKPDPLDAKRMSPDGESILRLDEKRKQMFIVHLATGKEIPLEAASPVTHIFNTKFSPDGRYVFITFDQSTLATQLWDVATGRAIANFNITSGSSDVTFSENSELVVFSAVDKIVIFNIAEKRTEEIQYSPDGRNKISFSTVQIAPDKKTLMAAGDTFTNKWETRILFFDLKSKKLNDELTPIRRQENVEFEVLRSAYLNRKGDRIITTASNRFCVIWKLNVPDVSNID